MLGSLGGINWTSSVPLGSATDSISSITGESSCTWFSLQSSPLSLSPTTSMPAALGPILCALPGPKEGHRKSCSCLLLRAVKDWVLCNLNIKTEYFACRFLGHVAPILLIDVIYENILPLTSI